MYIHAYIHTYMHAHDICTHIVCDCRPANMGVYILSYVLSLKVVACNHSFLSPCLFFYFWAQYGRIQDFFCSESGQMDSQRRRGIYLNMYVAVAIFESVMSCTVGSV
jgi:hypothetical protein